MKRPFLGLHPTILLLAGTHFLVDSYGNIYAPLLPLLIPKLGLSLATAGVLQMSYQMASSVMQLAFGHAADRWRPRLLVVVGPLCAVSVLSLIGLATNVWTLAAVLICGGLGAAAFTRRPLLWFTALRTIAARLPRWRFTSRWDRSGFRLGPCFSRRLPDASD